MGTADPKAVQSIRKFRHWKQRYDKNAKFVFRRATSWPVMRKDGTRKPGPARVQYPAGSIIPDAVVKDMGAKLRRWWEARLIELHDFGSPNVTTGALNMRDPTGRLGVGPRPKGAAKKKTTRKKAGAKKGPAKAKDKKPRATFEMKREYSALVLDLVAEGASQTAIAKALGCSRSTLKRYFEHELAGNEPPPAAAAEE